MDETERTGVLTAYSQGRAGTRDTIERLGLRDYADLLIALARAGLPLPPPIETPRLLRDRERAWEILGPRLARDG